MKREIVAVVDGLIVGKLDLHGRILVGQPVLRIVWNSPVLNGGHDEMPLAWRRAALEKIGR